MTKLITLLLIGTSNGLIYAVVAIGLVLIWRSTRVVNFAQAAMAMFSTYIAASLIDRKVPYFLAFVIAIVFAFLLGSVVERTLMRQAAKGTPISSVIVAVGVLITLEALAGVIWGANLRNFPSHFSLVEIKTGGVKLGISPFDIYIFVAVLVLLLALVYLFQYTKLGMMMRASAFAPEVSRLLGIRVGRMLTLGWALASAAGAVAGMLAAPRVFLFPNNMDAVLVFAFTAAIIGGLDSPIGALIGALVMGISLSLIGGYLGSDLENPGAFVILVVVLMARPQGIFSSIAERRV
ncbi:MAG: branched-chain amino acid ABC transporter permease [Actinomycetota bacterium]|nr:branched-chain amino acid ABC transporter permease [Actinomycetota bacterium]